MDLSDLRPQTSAALRGGSSVTVHFGVGFHGTSGDPEKVAFGADRLDEVPGAVQDCCRIGLAKDTSPQGPVTNRVEPSSSTGTGPGIACVLIYPLITEGMSLYAVRQMRLEPIPSAASTGSGGEGRPRQVPQRRRGDRNVGFTGGCAHVRHGYTTRRRYPRTCGTT